MSHELTHRERMLTLAGVLLAMFLGALDQTIVSTALPRIVADLQGLERFTWVATAYLAASTALVPIYGKLADTFPRRNIELGAVTVFLLGSALCGLAGEFGSLPLLGDGMSQLIIFRAVQGFGGAGLFAMAFIIIADLFPPAERGKYQGFVGAVFGISSVLGPFLGGLLTDFGDNLLPGVAGWRLVFYVNLPLGALALWFIVKNMPLLRPAGTSRLDVPAALMLVVGIGALIVALQLNKAEYPWTSPVTLGLLAAAGTLLGLFVARSVRSEHPILDFGLFRNKVFRTANAALFLLGGTFLSLIIFEPLFMVNVLGTSATKAGISLIPLSMGVVTGSNVAGVMVSRSGGNYKRWMLGGAMLLLIGLSLMATLSPDTQYWQVLVYVFVCGIGIGPSMPLYTLAIQNDTEPRLIGQATSASQFFRQIGGVVAAAVLGTVLTLTLARALPSSAAPAPPQTAQRAVISEGPALPATHTPEGGRPAPAVQAAFSSAISRIYLLTIGLVTLSLGATMLVPELPLRKTNAGAPPAVVE